MEKKQNSLPDINNHNHFAKIIKNFFHDDFVFGDCWYEKRKTNPEAKPEAKPGPIPESEAGEQSSHEDDWVEITSCRFKNIVFKKDEELEKYILGYINSHPDLEEFERLLSIYRRLLKNSNSYKQRGYIEKECREVFYKPELENKIRRKYQCIHNKMQAQKDKIPLCGLWGFTNM